MKRWLSLYKKVISVEGWSLGTRHVKRLGAITSLYHYCFSSGFTASSRLPMRTHLSSLNLSDRLSLPNRFTRDLVIGLILGITVSLSSTSLALLAQGWRRRRAIAKIPPRPIELRSDEVVSGVIGLIGDSPIHRSPSYELMGKQGNTPLIRINSLSDALGVEILVSPHLPSCSLEMTEYLEGKAEVYTPPPVRVARLIPTSFSIQEGPLKIESLSKVSRASRAWLSSAVIEDAESQGLLHPHTGSVLFEGTVGSTGISLATVGRAKYVSYLGYDSTDSPPVRRGYDCCIIMPDDVAIEKVQVLENLGAKVERVRPGNWISMKAKEELIGG